MNWGVVLPIFDVHVATLLHQKCAYSRVTSDLKVTKKRITLFRGRDTHIVSVIFEVFPQP